MFIPKERQQTKEQNPKTEEQDCEMKEHKVRRLLSLAENRRNENEENFVKLKRVQKQRAMVRFNFDKSFFFFCLYLTNIELQFLV